jgi:Skp1 family, tetramerisation domain
VLTLSSCLQSSKDGDKYSVSKAVAEMSELVKSMIGGTYFDRCIVGRFSWFWMSVQLSHYAPAYDWVS